VKHVDLLEVTRDGFLRPFQIDLNLPNHPINMVLFYYAPYRLSIKAVKVSLANPTILIRHGFVILSIIWTINRGLLT
jgi:hypothetical protein